MQSHKEVIKGLFKELRREGYPAKFGATVHEDNWTWKEGSLLRSKGYNAIFDAQGDLRPGTELSYAWDSTTKKGQDCAQLFIVALLETGLFEVNNYQLSPWLAITITRRIK